MRIHGAPLQEKCMVGQSMLLRIDFINSLNIEKDLYRIEVQASDSYSVRNNELDLNT